MVRLLGDENFNDDILQGVLDDNPAVVFVRVSEVGLKSKPDDVVLEWAAENGYVVVTHDVNTMIHEANKRIRSALLSWASRHEAANAVSRGNRRIGNGGCLRRPERFP